MLEYLATRFLWRQKSQESKTAPRIKRCITTRRTMVAIPVVMAIFACILCGSSSALAANHPTATITINNGSAIDSQTIEPTNSTGASKVISVPVKTTFTYTSTYTMGVGLDCSELTGTKLTNCQAGSLVGNEATSALAGTTDGSTAAQMQSQGNGAWGYSMDKTGGNATPSTYNKVPVGSNTNNVISAADSTGSNTVGKVNAGSTQTNKTVTLFFAAGVNGNQASDTYQGNILVTVVAEPITLLEWAIEYDLDGGTWSGANTGNQNGTAGAGEESVTTNLRSVTPTKAAVGGTSYTFDGWKDVDGSAVYTANASVTLTLAKPTLRLKAQWKAVTSLVNGGKMQDATGTQCKNTAAGTTVNMYDGRDNKWYIVGKLADGNCWMLQNLALEGGKTIYPSDSNITASSYTLPASNMTASGRWNSDTDATGYMFNGNHINTGSLESSYINSVIDAAPTNNTNPTVSTGAYYSYAVATAGAGVNTGQNQYYKVTSSICPKNWHLPTGGDQKTNGNGEFQKLYEAYSSDQATFRTAFKWAATGYCNASNCPGANGNAYYWSSTLLSATYGYSLYAYAGNVNPAHVDDMRSGYSVRCMLTAAS